MKRNKRAMYAVLLLPILLIMAGCPKGAYHDAVVIEHDASATVKAYKKAVEMEYANGRITQIERANQEEYIEKIAIAGKKMNADLQAAAANVTITDDLNSLTGVVGDLA